MSNSFTFGSCLGLSEIVSWVAGVGGESVIGQGNQEVEDHREERSGGVGQVRVQNEIPPPSPSGPF